MYVVPNEHEDIQLPPSTFIAGVLAGVDTRREGKIQYSVYIGDRALGHNELLDEALSRLKEGEELEMIRTANGMVTYGVNLMGGDGLGGTAYYALPTPGEYRQLNPHCDRYKYGWVEYMNMCRVVRMGAAGLVLIATKYPDFVRGAEAAPEGQLYVPTIQEIRTVAGEKLEKRPIKDFMERRER